MIYTVETDKGLSSWCVTDRCKALMIWLDSNYKINCIYPYVVSTTVILDINGDYVEIYPIDDTHHINWPIKQCLSIDEGNDLRDAIYEAIALPVMFVTWAQKQTIYYDNPELLDLLHTALSIRMV